MMRTKTINRLCREAVVYAIETLDIERALVCKKERDERRAEAVMMTGIETDIQNKANEEALRYVAECIRLDTNIVQAIESKVYEFLSVPAYGHINKTRLEIELDTDRRI